MISSFSNQKKNTGFTLLELLVAMAVFAFLAVASYGGLNSVLKTREHTDKASKSLRRLQMSLTIVQRDFLQLTEATIRNQFGNVLQPIWTPNNSLDLLELTRSGWNNPANRARSHLQRVAYSLEDDTFYRKYWIQLNPGAQQEPIQAVLLKDVEEVEFEFLDQKDKRWHAEWPPLSRTGTGGLPLAVRLTITFVNETELIRIFGINQ